MGLRDPDVLDITRKSGRDGLFLAPSWAILGPALRAREEVEALKEEAARLLMQNNESVARRREKDAERIEREAWATYEPAFFEEMRRSYVTNRAAWDALLARPRVVLLCYCADADRCHRRILRVDILPKLGAVDAGELPATPRNVTGRTSR